MSDDPCSCTCPPGERPDPCQRRYALTECWDAADAVPPDGPYHMSYWRDTPWKDLENAARMILSRQQFREWMTRPEVIERSKQSP